MYDGQHLIQRLAQNIRCSKIFVKQMSKVPIDRWDSVQEIWK